MKCDDVRGFFSELYDGEAGLEEISAHLRECPVCAAEYENFCKLINEIKNLPEPQLPPGFSDALKQAVYTHAEKTKRSKRRVFYRSFALAAAAVVLMAVVWFTGIFEQFGFERENEYSIVGDAITGAGFLQENVDIAEADEAIVWYAGDGLPESGEVMPVTEEVMPAPEVDIFAVFGEPIDVVELEDMAYDENLALQAEARRENLYDGETQWHGRMSGDFDLRGGFGGGWDDDGGFEGGGDALLGAAGEPLAEVADFAGGRLLLVNELHEESVSVSETATAVILPLVALVLVATVTATVIIAVKRRKRK